ncbi:MAG: hypothetical protein IPL08_13985 [Saprospiraceae bacterium]|nr:hypothetical protein [Saprospiraceae bacterium]
MNINIILITLCISCSSSKNVIEKAPKIDLLSVISASVQPILRDVREAYEKDYKFTNQVFVLRVEKVMDSLEVIISVYDESDFNICFEPVIFPLFGLFQFDAYSVLVYGNDSQMLFEKNGDKMTYNLLECKKNMIEKAKGKISYPPKIFEPTVWIFSGNSNSLTFREQSQFNIIE